MTTSPIQIPSPVAAARLTGVHHVSLTVTDVEASAAWYQRVLGLERLFVERHHDSAAGGYCVIVGPPDHAFSIGLNHHPTNAGESFSPVRTGLDHVCLHVPSLAELHDWVARLDLSMVEHSGIYGMDGFPYSLLTFRDPDGIQLELIAAH